MNSKVAIVIVTWKSRKYVGKCLECIIGQTCKNFEIIVVDNASPDGTVEFLLENYPDLKLISNLQNLGFAKAVNQGIKASQGEYVLVINPDVFPEPDFLEELVACLSDNSQYGSAGGKILLFQNFRSDSEGISWQASPTEILQYIEIRI